MLNWIKRLFGKLDRADAAGERIALAMEGIADDLEAARAMLRDRVLGIEEAPIVPALPPAEEAPARKNGRKAAVS